MTTLADHATALILEFKRTLQPGSLPDRDEEGRRRLPSMLGVGKPRQFIRLSGKMDRIVAAIARVMKQNSTSLERTHTDADWIADVRRALGPILLTVDLNGDPQEGGKALISALRNATKPAAMPGGQYEHAFGCSLFLDRQIPPFSIGPVTFEPRLMWLARRRANSNITQTTERRIIQQWAGKKLRKRKRSIDSEGEQDIILTVEDGRYVCSVKTANLANEAARLKAQTAARLAMTTIALCWSTPSKALDSIRLLLDGGVRHQRSIIFVPGNKFLGGSSRKGLPYGAIISAAEWATQLAQYQPEFHIAGQAISSFLSATETADRTDLMDSLAQALLWFHEGCRDEVDLMSVIKFTASMEALSSGGDEHGIRKLITARLGIQPNAALYKDGPTMKAAVSQIYTARSRTIHGTNPKIGSDWSSTRGLAEQLTRRCLLGSLTLVADNPTAPKL